MITNKTFSIIIRCIVFLLMLWHPALAQEPPRPCGGSGGRIDWDALKIAESYNQRILQQQVVTRLVRVYFHIVRNTDGSNAAATEQQIQNEFNQLIADYAANNLCFANMGTDFINNTQINTMLNADNATDVALLNPFLVPNCLNIFYHRNLRDNTGAIGGSAYSIPNTFCSIVTANINTWRTISHEAGHCLGLFHTFETAGGLERIDGINCDRLGDRVCDTPADPWSFRGTNPCFSNNGCAYTGTCTDPTGATNYTPPFTNIMSYWGVVGCNLTTLSNLQYARGNGFLNTNAGLQSTQSPSSLTYGPVNITSGFEMRSAIFGLSTTGNVFLGGSVIASLQGQSVRLNPGFVASPSSGSVLVRTTVGCN